MKVKNDRKKDSPFPLMMWEETIAYRILDHLNSPEYKLRLDMFFEDKFDEYQVGNKK